MPWQWYIRKILATESIIFIMYHFQLMTIKTFQQQRYVVEKIVWYFKKFLEIIKTNQINKELKYLQILNLQIAMGDFVFFTLRKFWL